jgi:hypothetical protein
MKRIPITFKNTRPRVILPRTVVVTKVKPSAKIYKRQKLDKGASVD